MTVSVLLVLALWYILLENHPHIKVVELGRAQKGHARIEIIVSIQVPFKEAFKN